MLNGKSYKSEFLVYTTNFPNILGTDFLYNAAVTLDFRNNTICSMNQTESNSNEHLVFNINPDLSRSEKGSLETLLSKYSNVFSCNEYDVGKAIKC